MRKIMSSELFRGTVFILLGFAILWTVSPEAVLGVVLILLGVMDVSKT